MRRAAKPKKQNERGQDSQPATRADGKMPAKRKRLPKKERDDPTPGKTGTDQQRERGNPVPDQQNERSRRLPRNERKRQDRRDDDDAFF